MTVSDKTRQREVCAPAAYKRAAQFAFAAQYRVEQLAQRPSQCDVLIERPGGEARIENGQFAPDRANLTIINACADTGCQRLPCRLTQAAEEEVK